MSFKHLLLLCLCIILLGCIHAFDSTESKDVSVDFYPCDSLGIPKYEFMENEAVYVKCVLSNQSPHPIKYKSMYIPKDFFYVEYYELADSLSLNLKDNYAPEEIWDEYYLLPNEQISGVEKYERIHSPLKKGRYWIELHLYVVLGAEYQYINNNRRKMIEILESQNEGN